jgi:SAM-dependent methyltransferase
VTTQRDVDLVTYYNREVHTRRERKLPPERLVNRAAFIELLHREGRRSLVEIGAGAGRDAEEFVRVGLAYTGVDLSPEAVALCRSLGLDAQVGSAMSLPFADDSFDAAWSMSTLVHVAAGDLDSALREIVRVVRPGAPVAIGTWGAAIDHEEAWDDGSEFGPPRFFSSRTDAGLQSALSAHGEIEKWLVWAAGERNHYQWAVLRTRSTP